MTEVSRRILCVDDDANLLQSIRRQLRREFDVTLGVGPAEGLAAIERDGPFAVVVSDFQMPGMNGIEFLQEVHRRSPDTVLVMLTSLADLQVAVTALHEAHIFRFLNKPCPAEILIKTLQDGLEQYRLVASERALTAELGQANAKLRALNERLEERVAERTRTIVRMHKFVSDLSTMDTLEETARIIVETAAEMLRCRRVSLMIPDASREYLTILAASGIPEELKSRIRVPVGGAVAGQVFADLRDLVVNAPGELPDGARYDGELFASVPLAATALTRPTGAIGVLNVTERTDGAAFDEETVAQLKAVSEASAIALSNQIRRQQRNDARDAIILALAKLAEHRDPETGAHLERVQHYSRLLATLLSTTSKYATQVTDEFIEQVVRSCPMHDIGKVGVPDHILLKPGRLTEAEFGIMKQHTLIGGDIIRGIWERNRRQPFLKMGMDIAYGHHERFDGGGYPRGIPGDEIPLASRIVAVADVYDALTTRRVYKPAMSHAKAREILCGDRGKHFDPDVVDAFVACETDFERLARELADPEPHLDAAEATAVAVIAT